MLDYFVVDINRFALYLDSDEFTLPMTHYVEHPYDIDYQFSNIAYLKGLSILFLHFHGMALNQTIKIISSAAAVLRMFWYTFGEEAFKGGVISYLKNKYSSLFY